MDSTDALPKPFLLHARGASPCHCRSFRRLKTALLVILGLAGCGQTGPARYELSGQITYDQKPVPRGYVRFIPDKREGNSGPGASAAIVDGKYQTMAGQGTVGGPHIVRITGTDGVPYRTPEGALIPVGRPLFAEYEERVDLPRESATRDFAVPASVK